MAIYKFVNNATKDLDNMQPILEKDIDNLPTAGFPSVLYTMMCHESNLSLTKALFSCHAKTFHPVQQMHAVLTLNPKKN